MTLADLERELRNAKRRSERKMAASSGSLPQRKHWEGHAAGLRTALYYVRERMRGATLADRMREAAETLEEVSRLYEAFSPEHYPWSPKELRNEADHVE